MRIPIQTQALTPIIGLMTKTTPSSSVLRGLPEVAIRTHADAHAKETTPSHKIVYTHTHAR